MPEGPELRIMSDFINQKSVEKTYTKLYHVEKGNNPIDSNLIENFKVKSSSSGKELTLTLYQVGVEFVFSIFMGMSGNWKFVETKKWNETKFVRMRLDTIDGWSLLLCGGYMGPRYKLGGFSGVKRGPDPVQDFDGFKLNVISNLDKKEFNKPICEVLLNQTYFSGVGNYIRSTILYYADVNPFQVARESILQNPIILDLCRDVMNKSYEFNGGQLKDWKNPFGVESKDFSEWVFYQKGLSMKDGTGRTFWYNEKWKK